MQEQEERLPLVLVAAPTSEQKDYCFDKWADQVKSFTYPNYKVILVDNSEDPNYHYKLMERGILAMHVEREGSAPEYITKSMNVIRQYFLEAQMDFLFMLESDVFVPEDIIERMLAHRKPVLNVSYLYRTELESAICLQGIVKNFDHATSFAMSENVGFHCYNGKVQHLNNWNFGADMELVATGIGCTMIHRDVVEQIPFRFDRRNIGGFADSYFHLDCLVKGVPNYIDTTILAEHDRRSWRSNLDVWKMD